MRHSICIWLVWHRVRIFHLSFMRHSIRICIYTLNLIWLMHFMIISILRIRCQMNFVMMLWWISSLLLNSIVLVIMFHHILFLISYILLRLIHCKMLINHIILSSSHLLGWITLYFMLIFILHSIFPSGILIMFLFIYALLVSRVILLILPI